MAALPEPRRHRLRRRVGERLQRHLMYDAKAPRREGGRRARAAGARHGRARRRPAPGRAGLRRGRQARARRQRPARLLQGPEEDRRDLRRASTASATSMPGDFATVEEDGTHHAARPRLRLHQLGRREDLPRRGRGRAEDAPGRVRRHGRRRARRALGPAGRRRRAAARGPHADASRRSPRTAATTSPATRSRASCTSSTRSSASPSGKPDYPWAKTVAASALAE